MTSRLPGLRERATAALVRNADLVYRHHLTFTLAQYPPWEGQFSVKDPQKLKPDEVQKLQVFAGASGLVYSDLRQVKHHPLQPAPFPGASAPFDGGQLVILEWSQPNDFIGFIDTGGQWVGQRTGTAVLRRP